MGLSWQQGPLGRNPNGTFLTGTPMPERVLYMEPLRRRMSVELGGSVIARSDVDPPAQASVLRDTVAFAWRTMDAFYEEDERILGHAADPYHRIDIRRSSRHLVVRDGDQVVADTHAPLVLYESGFAPRWYVPRADIAAEALEPVEGQTFCPYKGLASYYDVGDARAAAWSYRAPFEEVERIADLVSFYPEKVTITIDGEKLEPAPGQSVLPHGPDRNLTVDEIGGIQLAEEAVSAEA
jgi:uncharacterized protein (DUF427 family)